MRIRILIITVLFILVPLVSFAGKQKKKPGEIEKLSKIKKKMILEDQIEMQRIKRRLKNLRINLLKLSFENRLLESRNKKTTLLMRLKNQKLTQELLKMKLKISTLNMQSAKNRTELSKLKVQIAYRKNKDLWAKSVHKPESYTMRPYRNGILTISDRRIRLNGPIINGVADYISKRIHYYNNKSKKYPIFIVIDRCPGGSVMEGQIIIKAMLASPAPVYVVVKAFAASMAAVITTLAKHSFAYPNAVILHHQMSTLNWGNMTQLKEQFKLARKWEKRLMLPVARKMGISIKKFVRIMYKHNSKGDWQEFADRAKKLNWVNNVLKGIRETGVVSKPADSFKADKKKRRIRRREVSDSQGRRFIRLPRLSPFDYYFIYNPDNYYR